MAPTGLYSEKLGKEVYRFGLITVEDMVTLTNMLQRRSGELIAGAELEKWITSPDGCENLLALASCNAGHPATAAEVRKWGSYRQRMTLAWKLWLDSVRSGEEEEPDPNASAPTTGQSATGG